MALHKIQDYYPKYREHFDNHNILNFDLYNGDQKIGSIVDILVDDSRKIRYFVINTSFWLVGKKVLLPIGKANISTDDRRVYADLTRDQVENLPEFSEVLMVDYAYEERLRAVYRHRDRAMAMDADVVPVASEPVMPVAEQAIVDPMTEPMADRSMSAMDRTVTDRAVTDRTVTDRTVTDRVADRSDRTVSNEMSDYDRDTYSYDRDPDLYGVSEQNARHLDLYEERLTAEKHTQKAGEVSIGKHVETETAEVAVPIEKERIVIEEHPTSSAEQVAVPADEAFHDDTVTRVETYEETPDIHKDVYVREEVNMRKEVERDTVNVKDQVRKEKLDLKVEGHPDVEQRPDPLPEELRD